MPRDTARQFFFLGREEEHVSAADLILKEYNDYINGNTIVVQVSPEAKRFASSSHIQKTAKGGFSLCTMWDDVRMVLSEVDAI
jgi:hypothetical protein